MDYHKTANLIKVRYRRRIITPKSPIRTADPCARIKLPIVARHSGLLRSTFAVPLFHGLTSPTARLRRPLFACVRFLNLSAWRLWEPRVTFKAANPRFALLADHLQSPLRSCVIGIDFANAFASTCRTGKNLAGMCDDRNT